MKNSFLIALIIATATSSTAFANDLSYMINPPKEKTLEELQAEINKQQIDFQRSEAKLAELNKEFMEAVSATEPAAGGNAKSSYDHYLGH